MEEEDGYRGTWTASRSWERPGNGFSPRASRRSTALLTPYFQLHMTDSGFSPPELVR